MFRATLAALLAALVLAPLMASAAPAPVSSPSADELAGLWTANRWFGPFARGPLIIERSGASYSADMSGHVVTVSAVGSELSFTLPNAQGTFRGKLQPNGEIFGQWFPSDNWFISPVRLVAAGPNRWRGEIVPLERTFSFHLFLQKQPGGSISAILRNYERDWGSLLGVQSLVREGNVIRLLGKRAGAKEPREVVGGSYDAERQVMTLSFPERGGSFDFRRDGEESDFYPRGKHPAHYTYRAPLARDDGWPVATLADVDIDQAGIERMVQLLIDAPMEQRDTPKVHGVLIIRHGKLVLEEYFHGFNRDLPHDTRSAAKSVTSVLIGAAMQAGAPLKLSTPVYQLMNGGTFPEGLEPLKRQMTLEHLLTMSSGYFCDDTNDDAPGNEDKMQEQTEEPDWLRYTLKVPMATPPGENAVYCSASPNLALGMLSRATGEFAPDLFDRLVARPMKFGLHGWFTDPAGNPFGGGGMHIQPRDFAKFGQLILNGGTWGATRILSREYAAQSVASLYHLRGMTYGYLWWGVDFPYKNRTVHSFYAGGNGGQSVIVIPELDLIITSFGGNYASAAGTFYMQRTIIPRDLLPAVREPGDDPKTPVTPRENFAPLIGDTKDGSRIVPSK